MKTSALIIGAIAQGASAHYFFDVVTADGSTSAPFQYIREFTRETAYNPIKFSSNPPEDIRDGSHADGEDIICNQGAFTNAGSTEVLIVRAGDEIRVNLGVGATMAHPGPGLVYMSRAPGDDVKAYDGSGDWFKIFEEGVCNQDADFTTDAWCTWDRDYISATIPQDTPDGEYLVRAEHIGVHRSHVNQPEHYVSCVQVRVENGGRGTPGPMVQFPGAYKDTDEYANFNIYNGYKDFPMPGPAVWSGGGTDDNEGGLAASPADPVPSDSAEGDSNDDGSAAPSDEPSDALPTIPLPNKGDIDGGNDDDESGVPPTAPPAGSNEPGCSARRRRRSHRRRATRNTRNAL